MHAKLTGSRLSQTNEKQTISRTKDQSRQKRENNFRICENSTGWIVKEKLRNGM